MQLRIIKPGLLATIQDLGRRNYLQQAVPVSGAMDTLSARLANIAVGNADGAAVIEFTYAQAEFKTESDVLIAWSGDGAMLIAVGERLPSDRPLFIPAGTVVRLKSNPRGSRTYLAVAGGWDVPQQLGSRSTYITAALGGFKGRSLQAGDLLSAREPGPVSLKMMDDLKSRAISFPRWSLPRSLFFPADKRSIRVAPAHEFVWFKGSSLVDFLFAPFILGLNSNRMGYHLEGKLIHRAINKELLSTAVAPGTIQVTGNGSLVLLMADCQTTGGYPRIAQVAAVDLPLCGQLKPGDAIFFKEIGREEAEMLYIEREKQLQQLKVAVTNRVLEF